MTKKKEFPKKPPELVFGRKEVERDIEDAFVEFAKTKGCRALKLRIDGQNGFPDRTVLCPTGFVFYVEFKTPEGKLSAGQIEWRDTLSKLGFIVLTARTTGEAERFLVELLG